MSDLNKKNINYGALNRFYQDLKSHDISTLNDRIDNIDLSVYEKKVDYVIGLSQTTPGAMPTLDLSNLNNVTTDGIYNVVIISDIYGTGNEYCGTGKLAVLNLGEEDGIQQTLSLVSNYALPKQELIVRVFNGSDWREQSYPCALIVPQGYEQVVPYATYSATKINELIATKQNTLTSGSNITISGNTISALGYKYYPEQKSFKTVVPMSTSALIEKYTEDGNDLGSGAESFVLGSRNKLNSGLSVIVGNGNSIETSVSSNFIFGKQNKIYGGNSAVAVGLTNYINAPSVYNNLQYAIGSNLKVQNDYEGALGQYNVTHSGSTDASITRFSIGDGKYGEGSNGKIFENVIEVMRNGDTYIKGFGGYDGVHIKTETGYENTKTVQEYLASLEARIAALENPSA